MRAFVLHFTQKGRNVCVCVEQAKNQAEDKKKN